MPRNFWDQDTQNQGERYPLLTSPFTCQDREKIPSPLASGQTTPTNPICQMSPIPSTIQSINEETATPSTQQGATMSGPHSPTGTERFVVPTKPLPGNSDSRTLMPEQAGPTPTTHESIWTGTWQKTAETNPWVEETAKGASTTPGPWGSLPESTPTETDLWPRHLQATEFKTAYDLELTQSRVNWSPTSGLSSSSKSSDSRSYESFHFDEETFGSAIRDTGDNPRFYWGAPYPLPDQPPERNLQMREYQGPKTSRMIAGAGPGMEGLEEINKGWARPQQPQPPQQPTMEDRVNQLMQQMVNLRGENAQLRNEVQDLRQGNRGRPGAPPYRPDPDYYSIP